MTIRIRNYSLVIMLMVSSCLSKAAEDVLIDGLISDQVISRVGQLFYDNLVGGWELPVFSGNISVKERPDNFSGNVVWIEIDNEVVFESRVGFIPSLIEEKAQEARQIIEKYILDNNDSLHDLEGIK